MRNRKFTDYCFAIDCKNDDSQADFYAQLLALEKTLSGGGWTGIHTSQGIIIAFQSVEDYIAPA